MMKRGRPLLLEMESQGNATNSLYSHIGKHMNLTELNDQQPWFSGHYGRTWIDHDENGILHNVIEESRSSSTGFLPSLQELRKTFHFYPYISRHASLEIEISFPSVLTNRLWELNENSRSVVTVNTLAVTTLLCCPWGRASPDFKGTRPLTPRDKSGLLAMTW
ncbi:hypothetical protein Tco_0551636 [Tanacetum coccineum]